LAQVAAVVVAPSGRVGLEPLTEVAVAWRRVP
jgi:hypothetical protein